MGKNKEEIKKEIVQFAKRDHRNTGIIPSISRINKEFNISFQFYFPAGMSELYKRCGFKFSPKQNRKKFLGKRWRELRELKRKKIIDFAKKEYKKSGIVPSARKIDKKLNVSFWSCFPKGMDELYKLCN